MDQHSNIDIEVIERDDVVLVVVEGELDLCAAPAFEESLVKVGASEAASIVVDLDRVSFMDSAGLHLLLQFSLSEANRDRLALTRGSAQVQRLLEVTDLGRYLSFVPSPQLGSG
jgi:anti-sigma B factor antagonist